ASGTGLMNGATGRWDTALLQLCEIEPGQLPVIDDGPAVGLTPRFAARWPDLARARWHPARGDGACSNLGSDCSGPDRVALNMGTSSAMRVITPDALGATPSSPPRGLWRYRVDDRRSVVGGATSEGGNVHAWCRRVLALPLDDDALERALAEIPAGAQG